MKVGAYVISFNGLSRHLEQTVETLTQLADKIVVSVDKESDDGTLQWCEQSEEVDKVIQHQGEFPKEEQRIRKKAFYELIDEDMDWVIALDDDEILPEPEKTRLMMEKMLKGDNDVSFMASSHFHLWEDKKFRKDGSWNPKHCMHIIAECVAQDHGGSFEGEGPHKGRIRINGAEGEFTGDFPVIHYGWREQETDQEKKMIEKIRNDEKRVRHPEESDIGEIQLGHYLSIHLEPELQDIPVQWRYLVQR